MTAGAGWQAEFLRRLVLYVVRAGTPVARNASEYGWMADDPSLAAHVAECGLLLADCSWRDSTWTEFQGTFFEEPLITCRGTDCVVTCACTLVEREVFRYTGGYAALLRALTDG